MDSKNESERKKKPRPLSKKDKLFIQKRGELGNWTDAFIEVYGFDGTREQASKAAYKKKIRIFGNREYQESLNAALPDEDLAGAIAELTLTGDRRTRVQCAALAAKVKKWDQPDLEQQRGLQILIVSNGEVKTVENTERQVIDVAPAMPKQIMD